MTRYVVGIAEKNLFRLHKVLVKESCCKIISRVFFLSREKIILGNTASKNQKKRKLLLILHPPNCNIKFA